MSRKKITKKENYVDDFMKILFSNVNDMERDKCVICKLYNFVYNTSLFLNRLIWKHADRQAMKEFRRVKNYDYISVSVQTNRDMKTVQLTVDNKRKKLQINLDTSRAKALISDIESCVSMLNSSQESEESIDDNLHKSSVQRTDRPSSE